MKLNFKSLLLVLLFSSTVFAAEEPRKEIIPDPKIMAEYLKALPSDHVLGNKEAKVTVIMYSSLSCPHCAKFMNEYFDGFRKQYVDSGKVKFIHRDFPLNIQAIKATQLVQCVPQDQYMKFITVLFKQQDDWAFNEKYTEKLENIAKLGGLSGEQVKKCFANKKSEDQIIADVKLAYDKIGVNSTPTFFVNDQKYNFSEFRSYKRILDKLLKS